jgi:general secretion pathway protein D
MTALEGNGQTKILNAPSLVVLDGNEANINVGAEIPVATSIYSNPYLSSPTPDPGTGTNNLSNTQIQYRSTGITLSVSPRISAAGVVTMEVATEVSSPGSSLAGLAGSPPINRSIVQSTTVVKDGSSLVIAGLIKEEDTKSRTSIPYLGRIPVLGWLFGKTETTKVRTELVVIITPHVLQTTEAADETSRAVIKSLKNINAYIEQKKSQDDYDLIKKQPESEK